MKPSQFLGCRCLEGDFALVRSAGNNGVFLTSTSCRKRSRPCETRLLKVASRIARRAAPSWIDRPSPASSTVSLCSGVSSANGQLTSRRSTVSPCVSGALSNRSNASSGTSA
jgi:hypothetical protein